MSTRVRWLGHSCLLFESDGRNVLIDPFLTGNPKAAAKADEVPADLILISHGHGDHVGDAVAIAKRTGATVVSNYEISVWLQRPEQGLTEGPRAAARRRLPVRRVVRVKLTLAFHGSVAARRQQRRQPLRLPHHLPRRHQDLRRRRHRPLRRHGADRRGGASTWPSCRSATTTRWAPTTPSAPSSCSSPRPSCRSTTTRSRPSRRTPTPGPRASAGDLGRAGRPPAGRVVLGEVARRPHPGRPNRAIAADTVPGFHPAGAPVRLLADGLPSPTGSNVRCPRPVSRPPPSS